MINHNNTIMHSATKTGEAFSMISMLKQGINYDQYDIMTSKKIKIGEAGGMMDGDLTLTPARC